MKVLLVTWTWYSVGGDWTYVENLKKLYESKGFEVIPFSTKSEKNIPSKFDGYFSEAYDYKVLNKKRSLKNAFNVAKTSVVSFDALKKIEQLIEDYNIDFAHFHILQHYVTPAIIWKLRKHKIPIVWTLHEYKLICPEGSFVSNGKVCERCYKTKFYNCALHKCKKKSILASSLAALDAYFYHSSGLYNKVDKYLCPSQFLLKKYKQFGFDEKKLILTNYCYDIASLDNDVSKLNDKNDKVKNKYILFVGRIERLKGILTLIKAVVGTNINLKIAGTGPALEEMVKYVDDHKINGVEFLGFQIKSEVYRLTLNAAFVVCPSEWYENYPFSVIESLLLSKPVIGSKIGGIPELVIDNKTGFLFEAGNVEQCRSKILKLWNDEDLCRNLGTKARIFAKSKVNFETHWDILKDIIAKLPIKENVKI